MNVAKLVSGSACALELLSSMSKVIAIAVAVITASAAVLLQRSRRKKYRRDQFTLGGQSRAAVSSWKLVIPRLSKQGNVGALARSALAFGCDEIIFLYDRVSFPGWKNQKQPVPGSATGSERTHKLTR